MSHIRRISLCSLFGAALLCGCAASQNAGQEYRTETPDVHANIPEVEIERVRRSVTIEITTEPAGAELFLRLSEGGMRPLGRAPHVHRVTLEVLRNRDILNQALFVYRTSDLEGFSGSYEGNVAIGYDPVVEIVARLGDREAASRIVVSARESWESDLRYEEMIVFE